MENIVFYGLALVLTLMTILTVTAANLLHAAIALIGSFFATAAIYLLFRMEFVALAQIMVYIGGIVVFMVITILLTAQLGAKNLPQKTPLRHAGGLGVAVILFLFLWRVALSIDLTGGAGTMPAADAASLAHVGVRLLAADVGGFVVPFELISVLLLAALIGAVAVARRDPAPILSEAAPMAAPQPVSDKEAP